MEKLSMEELEELKEKEFAEKADRSKNTISLLRKHTKKCSGANSYHVN